MKNLIQTETTLMDKVWIAGLCLSAATIPGQPFRLDDVFFHYAMRYLSNTLLIYTENFEKGENYRFSTIAGIEIDRYVLLEGYSRIKPLVIPLDKKP